MLKKRDLYSCPWLGLGQPFTALCTAVPRINLKHSISGCWHPFLQKSCKLWQSLTACATAGVFHEAMSVCFLPICLQETLTMKEMPHSLAEGLPIPPSSPQNWRSGQNHLTTPSLPPLLTYPSSPSSVNATWRKRQLQPGYKRLPRLLVTLL